MSSVGLKSVVYHGDSCLGEVHVYPAQTPAFKFPNHEIRIARLSHPSERCLPLSVLLTISPFAVRCKLESASPADHSPLSHLHSSCFSELKTAVVVVGDEELHLVAMQSGKVEKLPCFWCCSVPPGLYDSCLGMLNMRCLAIVFDLDETLIVANTMKSFEDRMEFLQRRIACEADPLRVSGMKAELKRYLDDKALLKQYAENDHVMENGKLLKAQFEEIPSMSNNQNQNRVLRPIIRLLEKNIVLTRINPEIRDTSVLVKLRPAWEDLRSYLIAKGRKRFEVYVCTMAERDYALEMWRLLDPEAHLISSKQLADRIICVKSGSRKSLLNVCQDGSCHPKMAMVIDDRLNVWDDCDQPRVHVVPAFAPYYAPQAEMANAVPVLCVARNVACNVRGGFFKEFDETLLRKVYELRYEDQIEDLPAAPDVSSYLMSEDTGAVPNGNGNRDVIMPEGMSGAEIERRLNQQDPKVGILDPPSAFSLNNVDMKSDPTRQPMASSIPRPPLMPRPATPVQGPGLLGAAPREGEIIQSELERRRFLALQHGQDMRNRGLMDPPLVPRSPIPITTLPQRHGGWLVMEDNNTGLLTKRSAGVTREPDALHIDKTQIVANSSHHHTDTAVPSGQFPPMSAVKAEEASVADGRDRQPNSSSAHSSSDDEFSRVPLGNGDACVTGQASAVSIEVLQEIGKRCKSKVEFRSVVNSSKDLQFSAEILFTGEKIGSGTGRTRKEAQLLAADNALHYLASKYVSHVEQDSAFNDGKKDNSSMQGENGFLRHITSSAVDELIEKKTVAPLSTCEQMEWLDESNRLSAVISGINDMCVSGGLTPIFQDQPSVSVTVNEGEYYYQVEIDGQVVGKGTGLSKEAAKLQAAEAALVSLKSMVNQQNTKRLCSPRSGQNLPAKRTKDEVA